MVAIKTRDKCFYDHSKENLYSYSTKKHGDNEVANIILIDVLLDASTDIKNKELFTEIVNLTMKISDEKKRDERLSGMVGFMHTHAKTSRDAEFLRTAYKTVPLITNPARRGHEVIDTVLCFQELVADTKNPNLFMETTILLPQFARYDAQFNNRQGMYENFLEEQASMLASDLKAFSNKQLLDDLYGLVHDLPDSNTKGILCCRISLGYLMIKDRGMAEKLTEYALSLTGKNKEDSVLLLITVATTLALLGRIFAASRMLKETHKIVTSSPPVRFTIGKTLA
jgi:hypothetical protein